jgi:hypothetical protein
MLLASLEANCRPKAAPPWGLLGLALDHSFPDVNRGGMDVDQEANQKGSTCPKVGLFGPPYGHGVE